MSYCLYGFYYTIRVCVCRRVRSSSFTQRRGCNNCFALQCTGKHLLLRSWGVNLFSLKQNYFYTTYRYQHIIIDDRFRTHIIIVSHYQKVCARRFSHSPSPNLPQRYSAKFVQTFLSIYYIRTLRSVPKVFPLYKSLYLNAGFFYRNV